MANKTITELNAAGALAGADVVHIVDGDGNSRKMTLSALKTFINTDPTVVPSSVAWRGARLKRTSNQPIANATTVTPIWQEASLDTDNIWSGGAATRLTVPTGVTKVRLKANIAWASGATGHRYAWMTKNGVSFDGGARVIQPAGPTFDDQNIASAVVEVVAGDYFEVQVFHAQASSLDLVAGSTLWVEMEIVEATI